MYLSNVALMKAEQGKNTNCQLDCLSVCSFICVLLLSEKKTNESCHYVVSVNLSWIFFQLLKSLRSIF